MNKETMNKKTRIKEIVKNIINNRIESNITPLVSKLQKSDEDSFFEMMQEDLSNLETFMVEGEEFLTRADLDICIEEQQDMRDELTDNLYDEEGKDENDQDGGLISDLTSQISEIESWLDSANDPDYEYKEVAQWFTVGDGLMEELKDKGEVAGYLHGVPVWGRTGCGYSLEQEQAIIDIADDHYKTIYG